MSLFILFFTVPEFLHGKSLDVHQAKFFEKLLPMIFGKANLKITKLADLEKVMRTDRKQGGIGV